MRFVKIILLFFILSLFIPLITASINMQTAKEVADFHLQIKNVTQTFSVTDVIEIKNLRKQKLGFIVNLTPQGFVAVSPDTDFNPIIAYSYHNSFPLIDDKNNTLFNMLRKDMELRVKQKNSYPTSTIQANNELWNNYRNRNLTYFRNRNFQQWPARGEVTDGLVKTTWMQGHPYNKFCPMSTESGIRSFVGSVGVALAQIVNYQEFIGEFVFGDEHRYQTDTGIRIDQDNQTYDFPNFPILNEYLENLRNTYNSQADLSMDNLATLNMVCAIIVKTQFNTYESTADTENVPEALTEIFKYASARLITTQAGSFYEDLRYNITNELPTILAVKLVDNNITKTTYERAVVCDGFNTDGEIHINFGWGINSQNISSGWYRLPAVRSIRNDLILHGIMYIEGKRRLVSNRSQEKIQLPDIQTTILEDLFEDEVVTTTEEDVSEEEPELNVNLNLAKTEEDTTQLGQTSRFVVYEVAPVPVKQIPPVYPEFLKKEGVSGDVWLEVEVFENGTVGAVNVLQSLVAGSGGLDESAVNAVKQWEFSPAKSAGKPVSCWVTFPVTFSVK